MLPFTVNTLISVPPIKVLTHLRTDVRRKGEHKVILVAILPSKTQQLLTSVWKFSHESGEFHTEGV